MCLQYKSNKLYYEEIRILKMNIDELVQKIKIEQDKIKDDDVKIVAEELCISEEDAKEHIKTIIALSNYSYEEIIKNNIWLYW